MRLDIPTVCVIGGLVYLATRSSSSNGTKVEKTPKKDVSVIELIRAEAARLGIDPTLALAWADVESGLNPKQRGDLTWATRDNGKRYRQHVLNNARFLNNPARSDPSAWISYGLYQLLAAYYAPADQHPRVLFDPKLNVSLGLKNVKRLLAAYNGDVETARIAYVCGTPDGCDQSRKDHIVSRLRAALERWSAVDSEPKGVS